MSSAAASADSAADHAQTAEQLRAFTEGFQAKALKIIYEVIPTKIDALQAILTKYKQLPCDAPVFTPAGAQCNQSIMQLMAPIKEEIHALLAMVDPLRMWVSLNIPKIQDQKGVAVSVKEDLVDMLHSGKVSAVGLLESMTKYHVGRGKLVSKMLKFPLAGDHAVCIAELDNKQYFMLLNMVNDLKNNYSLIYDMILKNMDKIQKAQDLDSYQNMY